MSKFIAIDSFDYATRYVDVRWVWGLPHARPLQQSADTYAYGRLPFNVPLEGLVLVTPFVTPLRHTFSWHSVHTFCGALLVPKCREVWSGHCQALPTHKCTWHQTPKHFETPTSVTPSWMSSARDKHPDPAIFLILIDGHTIGIGGLV